MRGVIRSLPVEYALNAGVGLLNRIRAQAERRLMSPIGRRLRLLVRLILMLIISALPLLLLLRAESGQLDTDQYRPGYVDEMIYYHETGTFLNYGFAGGYYTFEESPAPLAFTRFDPHGPFPPMVYAIYGWLTGEWRYDSILWANAWYFALFTLIGLLILRLGILPLLALLPILYAFHPVRIFTFTSMTEVFNYGLAFIIAAVMARVIDQRGTLRRSTLALLALIVFAGSLFRLTWIFLMLPLFLLSLRRTFSLGTAVTGLGLLYLGALSVWLYGSLNAVYPYSFLSTFPREVRASGDPIGTLITGLVGRAEFNFQRIEAESQGYEHALRLQAIAIAVIALLAPLVSRLRGLRRFGFSRAEIIFHVCNLMIVMATQLFLYDMYAGRDYRVLAPHVLASLIVLLARRRVLLALMIGAVSLLAFPAYNNYRLIVTGNYLVDAERVELFRDQVDDYLVVLPEARGWCSTVGIVRWTAELMALPFGIGINKFENPAWIDQPRTRYLLMSEEDMLSVEARHPGQQYELLTETTIGNLYLNNRAPCPYNHIPSERQN